MRVVPPNWGFVPIDTSAGVHVYRILQEALKNVSRQSGAREAWVRLKFEARTVELQVEDHGKGFAAQTGHQGIGLVGMRERAELVGGRLNFLQPEGGGTLLRLAVPREKIEAHGG